MGGCDAVRGGGGLDAPGLWPSQAAVATERVALLYATRFQSESTALTGWVPLGRVIHRPEQPLPRMPDNGTGWLCLLLPSSSG